MGDLGDGMIEVRRPQGPAAPVLLSSPHSGTLWPRATRQLVRATDSVLVQLEDGPLDRLLEPMPHAGATVLLARFARGVVDANRDAAELDPVLAPGGHFARRTTPKVRAGLGVIPTRLAGRELYAGPLDPADVAWRLGELWGGYHRALAGLRDEVFRAFGRVILVDVHSMPTDHGGEGGPVDVAIGDRFGRTAHPLVIETIRDTFVAAGLGVARNRPYAGGFITEHYGRPEQRLYAVQLELRRGLFMDERTHAPLPGFRQLQGILTKLILRLADIASAAPVAAAAE
jgi:N-formylglutamate amidohydrolase